MMQGVLVNPQYYVPAILQGNAQVVIPQMQKFIQDRQGACYVGVMFYDDYERSIYMHEAIDPVRVLNTVTCTEKERNELIAVLKICNGCAIDNCLIDFDDNGKPFYSETFLILV